MLNVEENAELQRVRWKKSWIFQNNLSFQKFYVPEMQEQVFNGRSKIALTQIASRAADRWIIASERRWWNNIAGIALGDQWSLCTRITTVQNMVKGQQLKKLLPFSVKEETYNPYSQKKNNSGESCSADPDDIRVCGLVDKGRFRWDTSWRSFWKTRGNITWSPLADIGTIHYLRHNKRTSPIHTCIFGQSNATGLRRNIEAAFAGLFPHCSQIYPCRHGRRVCLAVVCCRVPYLVQAARTAVCCRRDPSNKSLVQSRTAALLR